MQRLRKTIYNNKTEKMSDNKTYFISLLIKEKNKLIEKQKESLFRFWNLSPLTKKRIFRNNRYIYLIRARMRKIKTLEELIENETKKN